MKRHDTDWEMYLQDDDYGIMVAVLSVEEHRIAIAVPKVKILSLTVSINASGI